MSHVRAIQWLCENVDDSCESDNDADDDADIAGKLSPTRPVVSSASSASVDAGNSPLVLVRRSLILDHLLVSVLDLQSTGRGFNSHPLCCQAPGKLAHVCPSCSGWSSGVYIGNGLIV